MYWGGDSVLVGRHIGAVTVHLWEGIWGGDSASGKAYWDGNSVLVGWCIGMVIVC